jgi:hypothetical protein
MTKASHPQVRLHGIRTQRSAADPTSNRKLTLCQQVHGRNRKHGHHQTGPRKDLAFALPQAPSGSGHDIGGEREQETTGDAACDLLGLLGECAPAFEFDRKSPD